MTQQADVEVNVNGAKAEEELQDLYTAAKRFKTELEKAWKTGDQKQIKDAEKNFKKVTKEVKSLEKQLFDVDKVLRNLGGTSLTDLKTAQRALNKELNNPALKRNSTEWQRLTGNLQKVDKEIRKVRAEMRMTQTMGQRMAAGFNKYFLMFGTFMATTAGMLMGFRKATTASNNYGESLANLSALTGLAGEKLDWLSERAKAFSGSTTEDGIRITKSAQDIIDAYTQMGSKRPELLKDKEALASVTEQAVILAQAAKMQLVPATNSLAVSMNQFNAAASEAPRYTNAIAAGSKEGAGDVLYLAKALEKSGTSIKMAGLEIEEGIAAIETLAPKFSEPTVAGTQLKNVMISLQMGADKFNPKIVGMSTSLDNLGAANLSVTELTKMFGKENLNAAQTLITGREEYERYLAAVTDTNVAVEQAIKNTAHRKAQLEAEEQALNNYVIILGDKLAPAQLAAAKAKTSFVKQLVTAVEWFIKYRREISAAVTGIIAYYTAVKIATSWDKIHYGYLVAKGIITKTYAFTVGILTGKIKLATVAQRAWNTAQKANIIGALIGLFIAAIGYLTIFKKKTDEAKSGMDELKKSIEFTSIEFEKFIRKFGSGFSKEFGFRNLSLTYDEFQEKLKSLDTSSLESMKYLLGQNIADSTRDIANATDGITKAQAINQKLGYERYLAAVEEELSKLIETATKPTPKKSNPDPIKILTIEELEKNNTADLDEEEERWDDYDPSKDSFIQYDLKRFQEAARLREEFENEKERWRKEDAKNRDTANKEEIATEREKNLKILEEARILHEQKTALREAALDFAVSLANLQASSYELEMQRELEAAGDNEEAKDRIKREYAEKQREISIAQIWFEAGKAVLGTWAGYSSQAQYGAIIAALQTATILATAAAQTKNVKAQQFYTGRYPVIGANDGKQYNANYIGAAKTGIVRGPSLVSDRGDEMIVDGPTTKNLVFNYPDVAQGIIDLSKGLTPQFADGRYPSTVTNNFQKETFTDPGLTKSMNDFSEAINYFKKNGMPVSWAIMNEMNIQMEQETASNQIK